MDEQGTSLEALDSELTTAARAAWPATPNVHAGKLLHIEVLVRLVDFSGGQNPSLKVESVLYFCDSNVLQNQVAYLISSADHSRGMPNATADIATVNRPRIK